MRIEETWNRDFQYEPVNSHKGDIRLLTILPKTIVGSSSKPACLIETANLNNAPRYTALSYTWGSPHNTSTVLVNGVEFTVTVNLATLLQHLQHETQEVTVWADAICIKQWDYEEKGLQIALMLRVYQTARSTYIWLGPAEDGSDEAMANINSTSEDARLSALAQRPVTSREMQAATMIYEYGPRLANHVQKASGNNAYKALQQNPENDRSKEAFIKLMNRHYFSRVWCMQELVVSPDAPIGCGKHTMDVEGFAAATRARSRHIALRIMDLNGRISTETQGFVMTKPELEHTMASRMLQQRQRYINNVASGEENVVFLKLAHLLSVLYVDSGLGSTSPLQSGDPRDRIYGMLGMAEDTEALGIVPNYNISWEEAYTDVMFKLLRSGYSNTLLLCQDRSAQPAKLPSWVPNFQMPLRQPPSQPPNLKKTFNACGSSRNMAVGHVEGSNLLRIRGFVVSTVTEVQGVANFTETELMDAPFQEIKAFLDNLHTLVSKSRVGSDESTAARVAVGDMEHDPDKDKWTRATHKTQRFHRLAGPVLKAVVSGKEMWNNRSKSNLPTGVKLGGVVGALTGGALAMAATLGNGGPFVTAVMRMGGRRPFLSADGRVGLGPGDMEVGDAVAILDGVDVPFVLRPHRNQSDTYSLVGEAYVHGIMDGEAANASTPKRFFDLI